jgi:hypothetical protein
MRWAERLITQLLNSASQPIWTHTQSRRGAVCALYQACETGWTIRYLISQFARRAIEAKHESTIGLLYRAGKHLCPMVSQRASHVVRLLSLESALPTRFS